MDPTKIDLFIVPGAVFDLKGVRIGYGVGYYDKFFNENKIKVPKIALAFEFQIAKEIELEAHDVNMDLIITENSLMRF